MEKRKHHLLKSNKIPTSWGNVAGWYATVVSEKGSYQRDIILPGVLRLLNLHSGEAVLDIACGEGFFAREFHHVGTNVLGIDAAAELIAIAKKKSPRAITYRVADAKSLSFLNDHVFDAVVIILALQNIDDIAPVLSEARRVLKNNGRMVVVLNHPVFRIPKFSGWGWDSGQSLQYRKINRYMTELKVPIQMHPGDRPEEVTWSFHRPLQSYIEALSGAGFCVMNIEEWISHKKSQPGPKAKAENFARAEFPLFLALKVAPKN